MNSVKPILVTPGEPAGIGPDILLTVCSSPQPTPIVAVADIHLLRKRTNKLKLNLAILPHTDIAHATDPHSPQLFVHHHPLHAQCKPGKLNIDNATYVIKTIKVAAQDILNNHYSALVTGPVHKAVINDAGIAFSGHTELLARLTEVKKTVMLFVTNKMKMALLTTHLPLRAVPNAINEQALTECITILHQGLQQYFGIASPRISVCGLNPHAGENGHLGDEEQRILIPTIKKLKQHFMLTGPLPADTAFTEDALSRTDVVLCMYHDQGLPVIKYQGFGQAVNVTLGLPFIRTSVDHGTALHLAGTGRADASSLQTAIDLARELVEK